MPLNSNSNLRPSTVILTVALIALLIGGVWFYRVQEQTLQRNVVDDLTAIGRLKVDQIAAWRKDQLADAVFLQQHPFLSTSILRFIADESEENKRELLVRFRSLADQHGYADMRLVAPGGKQLFSLVESPAGHRGYLPTLAEALRDRKPAFTELHMESPNTSPHISVVVPLYKTNGPEAEPFAALVLISDASWFLYPLIHFWPTSNETAETLLIRQDGDEVLFLNDLRHRQNTALKLRIPLSRKDVPAVMAVLGRQGVFQGKDYRGVEVVSVILPIPDSPWFMIAKIDATEAFAVWRFRSMLMLGLLFGLVVCIVTTGLLFWQRDKKAQYRALYHSEAALRATVERHSITLKAIGDAVIATDDQSIVELLNPVAEALTGWTNAEARGRPLDQVFRIVNEETGAKVADPVAKVLREGVVVGLANHTLLISRDGARRPIADSGAPIRDEAGRIIGVVLVFRDQTPERAAAAIIAERERYYRSLLFNLHEDILVIDRDYRITDINNTALQTLGLAHAEVVGRKCHVVSHGLDSPCNEHGERCALVEVFATGVPCNCRHDHVRPDGTRMTIDILMSPLKNEDGKVTHVIEAARDITDIVEARTALQQSEEKFRAIFENMALGCCLDQIVYNNGQAVDYRILDVNPAYERLIGISQDRANGTLASELYVTEQAPNLEIYSKVDTTGAPASFEAFFQPTGRHLQITASRIAPGIFCTLFVDITARRQQEKEYKQLIDAMNDEVFVTDLSGKFKAVNETAVQTLGYSRNELLAKGPADIDTVLEPGTIAHLIDRMKSERRQIFETQHKTKDGRIIPVEISSSLVNYQGQSAILSVARDITNRQQAEQERERLQSQLTQAQKMESVGRLAGGVAHDYNNMLSVIIGFTELALEKTHPGDSLHEDLTEILSAGRRSAEITRQLLAFARRQTIDPEAIDLNETVEGMLKMLRRLIGEDIDLAWQPGPGRMPVFMDPSQLDQLLANLCVNARDAIADVGKLTIETGRARFDAEYCADHAGFVPGDFIMLAVSDDGCGMDKETLDNIFEPFFTTKGVGEGTGLGLSTVFGIVKQNDGFINVYSEPGKGTTFKIYLPPHAGEEVDVKARETDAIPAGHGETVLVVEDEAPVLKMAQRILGKLGYTVLTAATPGEAMALAKAHAGEIHLLITDVVMPEMNGRELAESLRARYPNLKVLFMSGYTANVIAHRGMLDEGVHFVQKPFSNRDLAVKVRGGIGGLIGADAMKRLPPSTGIGSGFSGGPRSVVADLRTR